MKKITAFIVCTAIIAGCAADEQPNQTETRQEVSLTIRNPKVEIAEPFEQMVKEYEKENPHVSITVETIGGTSDDFSDLITSIAAGEGPDIFTNIGHGATEEWIRYLEDLSDEPWTQHARPGTLEPITVDGSIYGMPMDLEGFGIIYRKDLFEQAGITKLPETTDELNQTISTLEQNGITPFANGYYEEWKLGYHLMSLAFTPEQNPEDWLKNETTLNQNKNIHHLLTLLDTTIQHGNQHPEEMDYYTEIQQLEQGKAAMTLQGNWIQPLLNKKTANQYGVLPIPIGNEPKLAIGVPNYWVINRQSTEPEKQEAKKFLRWMTESPTGQHYLTSEFGFIPALETIPTDQIGPISEQMLQLHQNGSTQNSGWFTFSPPIKRQAGQSLRAYTSGDITKQQLLTELDQAFQQ